jgi:hypothetical protein
MCGALLEKWSNSTHPLLQAWCQAMPIHLNTNGRDETPHRPESVLLGTAVAYKLLKN